MKKAIILVFALFFLFLVPDSLAIIRTTFGGLGNDPSRAASDYNASCGKFINLNLANPCTNSSTWFSYDTEPKAQVVASADEFNFTATAAGGGGGGENAVRFFTGGLYNNYPGETCADFKFRAPVDLTGINFLVGYDDDLNGFGAADGIYLFFGPFGGCDGKWAIGNPGGTYSCSGVSVPVNTWQNITFCQNSTLVDGGVVYFNNSNIQNLSSTEGTVTAGNLTFYFQTGGGASGDEKIQIADVFVYPASGAPQHDSTPGAPPEIRFYNMTSEGGNGCTNWNTDKANACITSDTTPTVFVNTSELARCAIGISDMNYTNLSANRECNGAETTQHTCTLTLQDELTYENSYIYIGCKDLDNNENLTSTSGALRINITLDTYIGNSIELGIRNSLVRGYTIYTSQKVYARNSADSQATGTFDKVVKKLSKIWAFNWVSASDSYVNMFNITPVFYTWEFANKTNTNITNQVELLINATR